ncbi:SCO family protein [Afipia felis]
MLGGLTTLWWGTDGLTAITAESARRLDVQRHPRPLPVVALEDHNGAAASFADFSGKVILLDFVYTRCPTLCIALGTAFQQARDRIAGSSLEGRIVLLTVSFDPERDGPSDLADYADRYGGTDAVWRVLRAPSRDDTRDLLRVAKVIAVPDGFGGFVHNAAILVVDANGRLVRILDSDAVDEALATAHRLLLTG